MESIAEGPAKGKQRLLDRQLRLKKDPLHLAWWNMWWFRMERVAIMEEREQEKMKYADKSLKCMAPDKRNVNHICTARPESTGKGLPLSDTHARSPAKKLWLN